MTILTGVTNDSGAGERRKVVEHNAGPSAALPENIEDTRRTQGKPAARPGERRVLEENPAIGPVGGGFAQLRKGLAPSLFSPGNLHEFEGKSARKARLAQTYAIIQNAVGGLVPAAKQQGHFLGAHFSTK